MAGDHGGMGEYTKLEAERGYASGLAVSPFTWFGRSPSEFVVDPLDPNPELRFPHSARIFDEMRKTDPQVSANLRAMTQPILGAPWDLTGDDVDPEVAEFVRSELGLVPVGDPRRRRRRHGIVFGDHLRDALTCLPFGFAVFEQVYQYDRTDGRLHLRKLAPRPVTTIREIHVGRDGGLVAVTQEPAPTKNFMKAMKPVEIPVEKLVWYALDKEGADWTGVSVLRSAYKPWFIKEREERLSAQIVERNGMGLPVVSYDPSVSGAKEAAERIASEVRAGARAGIAAPEGVKVEILGVSGSTVDVLPHLAHHDQAISKSMLAMFLDLGHDTGARSLGETFLDVFLTACQAIANQLAETVTEHVIRDLVEHNFGADAPYPVLTAGDLLAARGLNVEGLATLAKSGLLVSDEPIRTSIRNRYGQPAEDLATTVTPPPAATEAALSAPDDHLARQEALMARLENYRKDR